MTTTCPHCAAPNQPADAFCASCGKALPTSEPSGPRVVEKDAVAASQAGLSLQIRELKKQMRTAFVVILVVAILTLLGAALIFALPNIAGDRLSDEEQSVLMIAGGISAALGLGFVGLAVWARKAPLPASVTALSIYLTVVLINAALDPSTLAQGIIIKIIIILALARAIQAGLKYREIMRSNPDAAEHAP